MLSLSPGQIQQAMCKTGRSPAPQRHGCLSSKVPHLSTGLFGTAQHPPGTGVTLAPSSSPSPHSKVPNILQPLLLPEEQTLPKTSLSRVRCFEQSSRDSGVWPGAPQGSLHRWNWAGGLAGGHNLSKPTPGGSEPPLAPAEGNSCWLWEAVDLFKLEGKQRQGSLGRRGGSGAGKEGWMVCPVARLWRRTGRQTLHATL